MRKRLPLIFSVHANRMTLQQLTCAPSWCIIVDMVDMFCLMLLQVKILNWLKVTSVLSFG